MKIGTTFSTYIGEPIARAFNLPCIDPVTRSLREGSTCAKVRDAVDEGRWRDAAYDFVWRKKDNTDNAVTEINNMNGEGKILKEWVIVHQIAVQCETWKEALGLIDQGDTLAVTVQLRQQQPSLSGPVRPPPQLMTPIVPGQIAPEKLEMAKDVLRQAAKEMEAERSTKSDKK